MKELFVIAIVIGVFCLLWMQIRSGNRMQMSFLVGETRALARR